MAKKMTKKEWYEVLKEVVMESDMASKTEAIDFINHEVELLEKKATSSKATKTQKENIKISEDIKKALIAVNKPVTISELQKLIPEMADYSNQKLSALLRKLVEEGEVVKTVEKKKSFFSMA